MEIRAESIGRMGTEIAVDAADGEVHDGELPGGGIRLLSVDADVAQLAAVSLDELFALHEESAGAVAGVVNAALVGREHEHEELVHALRGVELAAAFALGTGKATEEVFVDAAQKIDRPVGRRSSLTPGPLSQR